MKVLLVLAAVFVLGVGSCIGVGYYWFSSNAEELAKMGEEAQAQGEAFGRGKTADDCLNRTFDEVQLCDEWDLLCEVKETLTFRACLDYAAVPDDYCEGVPPESSIMDSVTYRTEQCSDGPLEDVNRCGRVYAVIQQYCHG
ncbi:MAG: hypothetical protein AAF658_10475 [Myxococcota bacterium]